MGIKLGQVYYSKSRYDHYKVFLEHFKSDENGDEWLSLLYHTDSKYIELSVQCGAVEKVYKNEEIDNSKCSYIIKLLFELELSADKDIFFTSWKDKYRHLY